MNITIPDDTDLERVRRNVFLMLSEPSAYAEESLFLARLLNGATPAPDLRWEHVPGLSSLPLRLTHPDGTAINRYNRAYLVKHGHTNLPPEPTAKLTIEISVHASDSEILEAVRKAVAK